MNDDKKISFEERDKFYKSNPMIKKAIKAIINNVDGRRLKERVFLLDYDKTVEILTLYYIFCGCSKPYCEVCQLVIDFKLG